MRPWLYEFWHNRITASAVGAAIKSTDRGYLNGRLYFNTEVIPSNGDYRRTLFTGLFLLWNLYFVPFYVIL